jgi:hypothetical protein
MRYREEAGMGERRDDSKKRRRRPRRGLAVDMLVMNVSCVGSYTRSLS